MFAKRALEHWGFSDASIRLVAERENCVYEVTGHGTRHALRRHRVRYRTQAELRSELDWMAHLATCGLDLPAPVPTRDGHLFCTIDGAVYDLLTWVDGEPVSSRHRTASVVELADTYHRTGWQMAALHDLSDAWQLPETFDRPAWNVDGLVGEAPLWGRFWDNTELSAAEKSALERLRDDGWAVLDNQTPTLDYGLIHADLVPDNVLVDSTSVRFIDFDDSGFGFRLFDLATTLNKAWRTDHYEALSAALLDGYGSRREIDLSLLPLFQALRAASYVGWNITRMGEPGGMSRNRRFIDEAMAFIAIAKG